MEFSELLLAEHQPIRRALGILEQMARQAELGRSVDRHDVNALLTFLHYFADACHQSKEESILFPVLRASEATHRLPEISRNELEDMLKTHHEERALIEQTQLALFSEDPAEFIANARTLTHVLSEHALKEETVLFPLAEKILTEEEAARVVMRIEQANAQFGSAQRTLLMDLLLELDRKYLPKAA